MEAAKRVVNPVLPAIPAFSEEQSPELRDRIFDEFNTLAVVYRQPSAAFVRAGPLEAPPSPPGALPNVRFRVRVFGVKLLLIPKPAEALCYGLRLLPDDTACVFVRWNHEWRFDILKPCRARRWER